MLAAPDGQILAATHLAKKRLLGLPDLTASRCQKNIALQLAHLLRCCLEGVGPARIHEL